MSDNELSFTITPAMDLLLRGSPEKPVGLYQLHISNNEQLNRAHFSKGSEKATQAKLKLLEEHGYVQHDAIPTKKGRSPYYYFLAAKGVEYLRSLGYEIHEAYRPSREADRSGLHITHTLELNDVIIAAVLLKEVSPDFYLHQFVHERDFKRSPYKQVLKSWGCEPDAFLDFSKQPVNGKRPRLPVFLEHDRGTELRVKFREKIRSYITDLKSGFYKELFGLSKITIAFTVFDNPRRLEEMRLWAREELDSTNEHINIGKHFLFTNQARPPDPKHIWLEPCWYTLIDSQPIALLGV